ncbi:bifunctional methylenetetrahydrofolate dehydrogenase/methenyltetrahydrofolate cyclohydrolase FolD [Methanospirillum stamsii]|uniref:Bifunctional protein FolD n=1 Tax=Methanospirillum stamsii TaxID=1277351 RepID=A0A2V2N4T1_9EURY|nr:bifunctional methylenetetrahydrofolate dehydrogenase/methenyltetrahydrofolate cyclohydrolase FolD [Methanospirillum stamsii]PWR71197.1 bifunctional methylenetetrahydrofolate dehydrogenase/methenyltetrahydrofolate cyclohydrolase FolD [Methanospirillum stamsii]
MILDGKGLAARRLELLKEDILEEKLSPTLATVIVGDDPASHMYVRMKHRACEQVGINSVNVTLPADTTTKTVLDRIRQLNEDPDIDGILVQLPLPEGIDTESVIASINPEKDVDGFHPLNMGRLMTGLPGPRPCTPKGIMTLLSEYNIPTSGKRAVIVGRSVDVGRPIGLLLLHADATVTICHSKTENLAEITRQADILVSAAGRAGIITADMVKPGESVIDVGTNQVNGKLCGDVSFSEVEKIAGAITPVPGGVGPMTIASLMENTADIARNRCVHFM